MIITLKSIGDASVYEAYPTLNTGLDEILEFGTLSYNSAYSRTPVLTTTDATLEERRASLAGGQAVSILNFDTSDYINWSVSSSVFLNLKVAYASELKRPQTIVVYPFTGSWEEGTGYFLQQPYNVQNGIVWNDISSSFRQSESASAVVNSFPLQDISIDVTSLIPFISASTLTGLIVALPEEDVVSGSANIKVFSSQTHTIYEPTLTVVWDDQVFSTGSLKPLPTGQAEISFRNMKEEYVYGSKEMINLVVRDKYPLHGFNAVARYENKYYLPQTSYFRIRDVSADTLIHDFSDGSKISCASNTSYFLLDTTQLYKGRYYRIEFKVVKANGEVLLFSPLETFVVR